MSNSENTKLIEEAYELTEHNKYNFMTVKALIACGDLDQLRDFVRALRQRERDFDFQNDDFKEYGEVY